MSEGFIYEEGSQIVINTRSVQVESLRNDERFIINDQEVSVERVELASDFLRDIPYSTTKMVYRVTINQFHVNRDLSFQLVCGEDEYFFAIEDDFLRLLENRDVVELINRMSPRVEILSHSESATEVEAQIDKQQVNYLLQPEIQSLSANELTDKKSFYIVLNQFSKETSELGLFRLLPDGNSSFRKVKVDDVDEQQASEKPVAIIVHGLVSSISDAYFSLFDYLQKDFDVYGFEYLTVNEFISDSGELFAGELGRLKKKYPDKEIMIVSHSMGGLVSRSAASKHGAKIDQLIMAGTPNHGSLLISVPILARLCLVVNGAFGNGRNSIKSEDFWDLVRVKKLRGLEDLANDSGFVSELNSTDRLDADKKYFAITGKYLGLSNDILVNIDNMISVNEIKMPHISTSWNHFNYYEGESVENYVGEAIRYLK
ncbi:esterase/lipase family protein [Paenisporosarcina sp.]|uniref:esterase/lipase family protein n=1 Tax=Paenisporosarcina sp. TaxID=1932001 RepID=UPI003C735FF5